METCFASQNFQNLNNYDDVDDDDNNNNNNYYFFFSGIWYSERTNHLPKKKPPCTTLRPATPSNHWQLKAAVVLLAFLLFLLFFLWNTHMNEVLFVEKLHHLGSRRLPAFLHLIISWLLSLCNMLTSVFWVLLKHQWGWWRGAEAWVWGHGGNAAFLAKLLPSHCFPPAYCFCQNTQN